LALKKIIADMGDMGLPTRNMATQYDVELIIIQRPRKGFYVPDEVTDVAAYLKQLRYCFPDGFKLLPKRWIVERT
jgi:hypothetical protein